jgi:hypothetical protein
MMWFQPTARRSWRRELLCGARLLLMLFLYSTPSLADQPCGESTDAYIGYKVNKVRIVTPLSVRTPLSFLFGSQQKLGDEFDDLLTQLPLKSGGNFDRALHNASIAVLTARYQEMLVTPAERIRMVFITPRLESCDDAARTIEVTYRVYSSEFLYLASRIFENPNDRITRSLAPGKISNPGSLANITNKLLPQPLFGYDRARELFFGTKASFTSKDGIIDRLALDLSASHNSAVADMNLIGSRDFDTGFLSHLNWRLGYNYYKLPSDPNELKAGTGLAQVAGASEPLGGTGVVLRFGASVEAGNRQTDVVGVPVVPQVAETAGYGAVKLYVGATANRGRQSWSASYGLQLSNDGDDFRVAYLKHIFDASYRMRYLWREHRPFRLEAQFSAGTIQTHNNGVVPVVERFFGGNKPRRFIDGDEWIINSNPLIRSFPQNSLNLVGVDSPIGGDNFFSASITASQPVWNFPAVPAEISEESIIRDALGGQLRTARQATLNSYVEEEREYVVLYKSLLPDPKRSPGTPLSGNLDELSEILDPLTELVARLKTQLQEPSKVLDAINEIEDEPDLGADLLGDSKSAIDDAKSDKGAFKAKVKELVVGSTTRRGLIPRLADGLTKLADALRRAPLPTEAQQTAAAAEKLKNIQQLMTPKVAKLVDFGQVKLDVFMPARAILKDDARPDDMSRVVERIEAVLTKVSERANTIPRVGRSVMLTKDDVKNPSQLVSKLKDNENTLSKFLKSQLSPTTRQLLAAHRERKPVSDQLVGALVDDLNRLISGPSLFDEERFGQVELSEETKNLAARNPQGTELISLNRSLLAEAYPGAVAKSQFDESLQALEGYLNDAGDALAVATADPDSTDADQVRNAIHQLVVGFGDLAPPVATSVTREIRRVEQTLLDVGLANEAWRLKAESEKLSKFRSEARRAFDAIPQSGPERKADRDIGDAARSLDVIFREINLLEIAPTVTFDVARIGPALTPGFGKVHYGLGGGVRFSIVTLDLTAGYAFNLNRQPTERRGAFIISMTISDLFR